MTKHSAAVSVIDARLREIEDNREFLVARFKEARKELDRFKQRLRSDDVEAASLAAAKAALVVDQGIADYPEIPGRFDLPEKDEETPNPTNPQGVAILAVAALRDLIQVIEEGES